MQQSSAADSHPELPSLPGLHRGFTKIRQDQGRHVGFGMTKPKELVKRGVDPTLLSETVMELMPLVNGITAEDSGQNGDFGPTPDELRALDSEAIPDVETLTQLDGAGAD